MKNRGLLLALPALLFGWAPYAHAQWMQWGQNGAHTSFLPSVQAQSPDQINWTFTIDPDVPPDPQSIFIHYAAPIVLDDGSMVVAIRHQTGFRQAVYDVQRIDSTGSTIWGPFGSDYHYPTHNWEPVFQPIAVGDNVYYPGAGGVLHVRALSDGTPGADIASYPIPTDDPTLLALSNTVYVGGVPAADSAGNIYWTVRTQGSPPLGLRNQVVKASAGGAVISADFADLTGDASFVTPLNAGPAIAADGTIYVVTRKSLPEQNRLLGLNPDLTLSCTGNLAADPTHVARIIDDSSSVPVVGPDGRVYYGGWNSNGLSRGYLYEFTADCTFVRNFDFGWDDTPAVYQPDLTDPTTYYLVQKDNHYSSGPYYIDAVDPNTTDSSTGFMQIVWQYQLPAVPAREWCINQPAIDMNGTVMANGEDGYFYAIAWGATSAARIFLAASRDAAYTPLAIARDGTILTLNNGRLFSIGAAL